MSYNPAGGRTSNFYICDEKFYGEFLVSHRQAGDPKTIKKYA